MASLESLTAEFELRRLASFDDATLIHAARSLGTKWGDRLAVLLSAPPSPPARPEGLRSAVAETLRWFEDVAPLYRWQTDEGATAIIGILRRALSALSERGTTAPVSPPPPDDEPSPAPSEDGGAKP